MCVVLTPITQFPCPSNGQNNNIIFCRAVVRVKRLDNCKPLDDVWHCASPENVSCSYRGYDFSRCCLSAAPRSHEKVLDALKGEGVVEFSNYILIFKKIP